MALMVPALSMQAQNPYNNYQMVNTHDIIGTSRYVGMGGAMGALGADISTISNNPAGIGLYRRNDISMTMGGVFQEEDPAEGDNRGHFSFDQIGFVASFPSEFSDGSLNFGLNFQKKADYSFSQYCGYDGLNGLSQAAQLRGLYQDFYKGTDNGASLPVRAYDAYLYDMDNGSGGIMGVKSDNNTLYRYTHGNLYGLDLNLSGAVNNQLFLGLTMGIDFARYRSDFSYVEQRADEFGYTQDYEIAGNQRIDGTGFNFKLGTIFRPFEDSPFRIGLAIETPTWYRMKQEDSYYTIYSKNEYNDKTNTYSYINTPGDYQTYDSPDGNYLDYNVFSPWKFRVAMGSTVDNILAWDVEYEYGLYNCTKMGYPRDYDEDGPTIDMDKDRAMTELNDRVMNNVHNVRAGMEVKPVPEFALRAGYNFFSKPMKDGARLDQTVPSEAFDYSLSTDYINLNEAHVFTFGLGYRYKKFYADMAYKYRAQTGDFYAFDDQYQAGGVSDSQFMTTASSLKPTEVCLDRHSFSVTLGFKF